MTANAYITTAKVRVYEMSETHSPTTQNAPNVNRGLYGPLLQHVANADVDLRKVSEPTRQRLIDLAMMEPALVDVDADRVFLTEAGRDALAAFEKR